MGVELGPEGLDARLRGMKPSATLAMNEESDRLRAKGRDIFKLGLGQSPFPVPEVVVQALRESAGRKEYLPVRGLPALREAVAGYHGRAEGIERAAADVLIGPGSKELIFLLQLAHDATLLLPSPSWVSYAPQARMLGREVEWLDTRREAGWALEAEALDAWCARTPGRRLLILNYPNNPTGGSYDPAALEAIGAVARRHGLLVISDEIYGVVHHRGEHVSLARYYPEGTIISSGLSKWCGAGGWRLGTMVFPPALRWLLDAMAAAASETFTAASAPIQCAAVRAYQGGPEIEGYVRDSRRILAALGGQSAARLRQAGLSCPDPVGGFYLFVDASDGRQALAGRGRPVATSRAMVQGILADTGVAVLPGSDFGRPADELTLRLAYVDFDGDGALAAAAAHGPGALDEGFTRRHCPRVVAAIERLAGWFTGG